MIGRLRGTLLEKQAPYLLLDVGGVGYELQASMTTFYRLPALGEALTLHTHFVVREDGHYLYGFFAENERTLFRTLIKINGVGPKLALTILSSIEPSAFMQCVAEQDTASLVRLPGVGKKTAERLVIEMRDKLADWEVMHSPSVTHLLESTAPTGVHSEKKDAIYALINLGYKPQEASSAIAQLAVENLSSEELIRQALKNMAR